MTCPNHKASHCIKDLFPFWKVGVLICSINQFIFLITNKYSLSIFFVPALLKVAFSKYIKIIMHRSVRWGILYNNKVHR